MVNVDKAVAYLAAALKRPIEGEASWGRSNDSIVQRCPICTVPMAMRQVQAPSYAVLFQRLFAFYDAHECHGYGCTFEEAYQRAELASVRLAESAEALRVRPPESEFPALHERAERESLDLAAAAQRFERRLRAG